MTDALQQKFDQISDMTSNEVMSFAVIVSMSDITPEQKEKFQLAIDDRINQLHSIHSNIAEHSEITPDEFSTSF